MRGELKLRFLDFVENFGGELGDYIEAVVSSGYGASFRKLEYEQARIAARRSRYAVQAEAVQKIEQQYYNLLFRAKRDGLVCAGTDKKFQLTGLGIVRLRNLKQLKESALPASVYQAVAIDEFIAVSFDIPEKLKIKRAWLRKMLKQIGFAMVQQSFWLGNVRLPVEFIEDARRLGIAQYIEIFSVQKKGSLDRLSP